MSAWAKSTGRTPKPVSRPSGSSQKPKTPRAKGWNNAYSNNNNNNNNNNNAHKRPATARDRARSPSPQSPEPRLSPRQERSEVAKLKAKLAQADERLRQLEQRNGVLESASIKTISDVEQKNEDLSSALALSQEKLQATILSQTQVEKDLNTALLQITAMGIEIQELQRTCKPDPAHEQQLHGLMQAKEQLYKILQTNITTLNTPRTTPRERLSDDEGGSKASSEPTRSPNRRALVERLFRQYSNNQPGGAMQLSEFCSFARDFGLLEHFSTQELRVLFVQDTTHAKSRRSKLTLDEFVQLLGECTSKLEQQGVSLDESAELLLLQQLFRPGTEPASSPEPPTTQPTQQNESDLAPSCYGALRESTTLLQAANDELQTQLDLMSQEDEDDLISLHDATRLIKELSDSNRSLQQETLALRSQLARSMMECQQLRASPRANAEDGNKGASN